MLVKAALSRRGKWTLPASDQLYAEGVAAANRGDFKTAVRVWSYASMAGHVKAQYNLGVAYAHGRGVPKDALQAKRWWTEAAAQGHAEAARQLDEMLEAARASPSVPRPGKSTLGNLWSVYLTIGVMFATVKLLTVAAWAVFGGINQPDVPWYARLLAESETISMGVVDAVFTTIAWPYSLYILFTDGMKAFVQSMFYLWYR
jgi:hypothetical protein